MSAPRGFGTIVRERLRARLAVRIALGVLSATALVAAFAPLIALDRPFRYVDPSGAARWPLFAGLDAADRGGLGAGVALLIVLLGRRLAPRPRAIALLIVGVATVAWALLAAAPRHDGRRYHLEHETRARLAELDREVETDLAADRRVEARKRLESFLSRMPLLIDVLVEVEGRLDALDDAPARAALRERNAAEERSLAAAIFPPIPYAPDHAAFARLARPGGAHLLGTDGAGRDLAARLVHGARHSFALAAATALLAALVGLALGVAAGLYGGAVDWIVSRLIETAAALPALFVLVTLTAYLPPGESWRAAALIVFLVAVGWALPARLVRTEVARLRELDFVTAARALGVGDARLVRRHLVPNAAGPLLVATTVLFAAVILAEAALSFLGLGTPGAASWGQSLREAREAASLGGAWHLAVFPGLAIFTTIFAVNLVGDALRDATDPRG
ncbi:MAG: ABC transporter permease [Planctomycetota bacterium]